MDLSHLSHETACRLLCLLVLVVLKNLIEAVRLLNHFVPQEERQAIDL